MSDRDFKQQLESLKKFNKETASSAEKARAVMVKIGVLDGNGDVTPAFRKDNGATQQAQPLTGVPRNGASHSR